jgi:hypothetical protein
MARLVNANPILGHPVQIAAAANPGGPQPPNSSDNYLTRVAKYVPAEIVAAYAAVQNILTDQDKCTNPPVVWYVIYAVFVVLTPLYLFMQRTPERPYVGNVVIGAVAFVVWSYALTACPKFGVFFPLYNAQYGAVLLILFSLASGLYNPK